MRWKLEHLGSYADRVRRSSREIIIASALTLAALAFFIAALVGGAVTGTTKVGHMTAEETPSNKFWRGRARAKRRLSQRLRAHEAAHGVAQKNGIGGFKILQI